MNYEKKYKEALERMRYVVIEPKNENMLQAIKETVFPELKELEDEKIRKEIIYHIKNCDDTIDGETEKRMIAWLEKQGDHKLAWSEEDEEMCQETIGWFEKKCFPYALENDNPARESIKWLKSLKDRVQPKQEWTEEDKRILDALITSLINERFAGRLEFLKGIKVSSVIDWLKSLKNKIKKETV